MLLLIAGSAWRESFPNTLPYLETAFLVQGWKWTSVHFPATPLSAPRFRPAMVMSPPLPIFLPRSSAYLKTSACSFRYVMKLIFFELF